MKYAKHHGIRSKIFLTQIILISISMIFSFILYATHMLSKSYNDLESSLEYSSNITALHVEKYVSQMKYTLNSVLYNTDLSDILSKKSCDNIFEKYGDYTYISNMVSSSRFGYDFPTEISIYVPNPDIILCDNDTTFPLSAIEGEPWFPRLSKNENKFFYYSDLNGDSASIFIICPVYAVDDYSRFVGYIRISADVLVFEDALNTSSLIDTVSILTDADNNILHCSDAGLNLPENVDAIADLPCTVISNRIKLSDNESYYAIKRGISDNSYNLYLLCNIRHVYSSNTLILCMVLLILLIVSFIALFISDRICAPLTKSLAELVSYMQNSDFSAPESLPCIPIPQTHNEVTEAIGTYNHMITTIQQLIEHNAEYERQQKKATFDMLQMQIKPHFLYNTLNTIQCLAMENRNDDVVNMIRALSQFYKLSLHNSKELTTVQDELDLICRYIEIENFKYGNTISLKYSIDDKIKENLIPKLTLQPIIENSVKHGILEKESETGNITINAKADDSDVYIYVTDDGVGIPPEKITELKSSGGGGIGFTNTDKRIKLFMGNGYGLDIESKVGEYTTVIIKIRRCTND